MDSMDSAPILIAGGGIGGLSTALSLAKAGAQVNLFEQAMQFEEIGAGLQLTPNATRILYDWGLQDALQDFVVWPESLMVRDMSSGKIRAGMRLDPGIVEKYGSPYICIHRADLQKVLVNAVLKGDFDHEPKLMCNHKLVNFAPSGQGVVVTNSQNQEFEGSALIAADGLHSAIRQVALGAEPVRYTGTTIYRACFSQAGLPQRMRRHSVELWLGKGMHAVLYPVRRSEMLNVGLIVRQPLNHQAQDDQTAMLTPATLPAHTQQNFCTEFSDLITAISHQKHWREWPLFDRPPIKKRSDLRPRGTSPVVLLGDAAHAMPPHLGQGAAMAIEDAACLGNLLSQEKSIEKMLAHYAEQRWRRNAKVQKRSLRNGKIYQAQGLSALVRNIGLSVGGKELLEQKWLWAGG